MELTCDQDDALRKAIKRCVNKILIFAPSLNISKNLPKIKAKEVGHVMEAIVNLIQVTSQSPNHFIFSARESWSFSSQEEESSLQKLNLSDCKLKTDINNVINALGSNQCLQVMTMTKMRWWWPSSWWERRWCSLKANQRLLCQKCFTWMISDNQHILPVRCDIKHCFQNCFGPSLNIISQISLPGVGHQWERYGRRGCAFACKSSSNQHQAENCSPR